MRYIVFLLPICVFLFSGTFASAEKSDSFSILEEYKNVRNPFRIPPEVKKKKPKGGPLEEYDLDKFQLVAVITGKKRTRGMVILPNKRTYYIRIGDRVGTLKGVVKAILPERVLVIEQERNPLGQMQQVFREITLKGTEPLTEDRLKKVFRRYR